MAICGAKKRGGGGICKMSAMANGRCRLHGGKSTGAPKGNKNSAKPGSIYSKFLTDDEQQLVNELELGSLDDELKLTKIRLMRALKAEEEQQQQLAELELDSYSEEPAIVGGMPVEDEPIVRKQFKRRDYATIIDRLTARIESLELKRSTLLQMSLDAERKTLENQELGEKLATVAKDEPITAMEVVVVGTNNTSNDDAAAG